MRRPLAAVAAAAAIACVAEAAAAQTIVGVDALGSEFYAVDPRTGAATILGDLGPPYWINNSLARDSQGRFFVARGLTPFPFDIYEIDTATWTASFVVHTPLNGIRGLAFGPGDVLYAIHDTTVPVSGGPDDLYTIDLTTGAATRIGATGMISLQALTYSQGTLWGWGFTQEGLVTLDPATGLATDVSPGVNDPSLGLFQTICFSDGGTLYGADGFLATVDPITGASAYVGLIQGGFALLGGMDFLPNEPEPFALWVQGKAGGPMALQTGGATPSATVAFLLADGGGGPITVPAHRPCGGLLLDLNPTARLIGIATADAQGRASLGLARVPAAARERAYLQAVDLSACATSNRAKIMQ